MTNAFASIAQDLNEAIALNEGKDIAAKTYRPEEIDVAQLRRSLGLTQADFAAKFCISIGTLRHWERGNRKPHGPALAVAKEPQACVAGFGIVGSYGKYDLINMKTINDY